jgi:hypothetical protein
MALPKFMTEKLVATPEDPTTTVPRLTGPTGSKLMTPEERSEEILLQPTKIKRRVTPRIALRANIQSSKMCDLKL